ncbi:MAG: diguanylate cyclase [Acidimicrobiia bacterium]
MTPAPAERALVITDRDRADARAELYETSAPLVRWAIVGSVLLVGVSSLVGRWVIDAVAPELGGGLQLLAAALIAAVTAALPLTIVAHLANSKGIDTNADQLARDRLMHVASERREFETGLANAFEMAESEPDALEVTERALAHVVPDAPAELLLADNSHAHLVRVAVSSGAEAPGCDVDSPQGCVAARRGQTMVFPDSDALDACPKLRNRPSGAGAAVCVPVSIMGRSVGVLHVTNGGGDEPVRDGAAEELQVLANQVGNRIGMLRVMAETQLQASTDGLTGLLNRRSFENKVRVLRRQGSKFALVMADLDHFKRLNDTYGHDAGDRALRIFSETLRSVVRPDDIVCRHGGEEFAMVLPDCTIDTAVEVMERAQRELQATATRGDSPPFTASFGVVGGELDEELEGLITRADAALYRAKGEGRNRVMVDGQPSSNLGPLFAVNGHATAASDA